jgi:predicted O-methyltransferase YrrM
VKKITKGTLTDLENMNLKDKLGYLKQKRLKNMTKWELRKEHSSTWKLNGLSNLKYRLLNYKDDGFCSTIVVDIREELEISRPENPILKTVKYAEKLPYVSSEIEIWSRTDLQYNSVLKEIFATNSVRNKDGEIVKFHSAITPREGFHLFDLILQNGFSRILEVGMAYGTSALYMAQALANNNLQGSKLTSIDPFQSTQWSSIGILNIERAGLSKFHHLVEESSHIAMPRLLAEIESNQSAKFDMIFIDGMHLFDYTLVDIFYAFKMLRIGGVIVVDDIRHAGVKKAISYITLNYQDSLILLGNTPCSRTAATFIKADDDKRPWDYHTEF